MNWSRNALPAPIVEMPRKRSSFTSRSCSVLFIRSTRPFACGELAQMMSMLSSVLMKRSSSSRPGGVVDVDQERAARTAVLEPGVLATIDLHELAQAFAPVAWLMRRPDPLAPGDPDAGTDQPSPQRFPGHLEIVQPEKLLARQRGAEVDVALAHPSGPRSTITPQRHPTSLRVRCPRTAPGGVVDFGASADRDPLPDSRLKLPAPCRL